VRPLLACCQLVENGGDLGAQLERKELMLNQRVQSPDAGIHVVQNVGGKLRLSDTMKRTTLNKPCPGSVRRVWGRCLHRRVQQDEGCGQSSARQLRTRSTAPGFAAKYKFRAQGATREYNNKFIKTLTGVVSCWTFRGQDMTARSTHVARLDASSAEKVFF
jgi:hypothetical protein